MTECVQWCFGVDWMSFCGHVLATLYRIHLVMLSSGRQVDRADRPTAPFLTSSSLLQVAPWLCLCAYTTTAICLLRLRRP